MDGEEEKKNHNSTYSFTGTCAFVMFSIKNVSALQLKNHKGYLSNLVQALSIIMQRRSVTLSIFCMGFCTFVKFQYGTRVYSRT